MKYRGEIDGLRAVAVVPVVLFHAGLDWFSGGFVGVDVFFVISGYLITSIIIEEMAQGKFSLLNFYERRARRILPALGLVTFVSILMGWWILLPNDMRDFAQSVLAVSVFSSNILFWLESGYFDTAAELKPLLHTWSLAVEEQFYILFPLLLMLTWQFGTRTIVWTLIVLFAASLAAAHWGAYTHPSATFFLLPTRAWQLIMGCLAAFILTKRPIFGPDWLAQVLSAAGLLAVLFSVFAFDEHTPFPSLYALAPTGGALAIIVFARQGTIVHRVLSVKGVVGVGLVSYSLYLWHQPLFSFLRHFHFAEPSGIQMALALLASFVLAIVTYAVVETPFRGKSGILHTRQVFLASGVVLSAFIAFGVAGHMTSGFASRIQAQLVGDVGVDRFLRNMDANFADCEPAEIAQKALAYGPIMRCKQTRAGDLDWVLLGDSHAEHLFPGLAGQNSEANIGYFTFASAPFLSEEEFAHVFEYLSRQERPLTIFLTMHYVLRGLDGQEFRAGFDATISHLLEHGHSVVLLGDVPKFPINPSFCAYRSLQPCAIDRAQLNAQLEVFEPVLRDLAQAHAIPYIALHPALCDEINCKMYREDTILYRDANHLNIPGSYLVGNHILRQLAKIW